jgi:modulator of drug activity B
MPKNIFIISGKQEFAHSGGKLNQLLVDTTENFLKAEGINIQKTTIIDGYNVEEEVNKYLLADVVIYQFPVWWMQTPWRVKKYCDEVLIPGKLYKNDGRVKGDNTKKYGSGGLLIGKKYMLSLTFNAPKEAFTDKDDFFEGKSVEDLFFSFHKMNQFLGMQPLKTFVCNDVMKNPDVDSYLKNLKSHIQTQIINS